MAKKSITVNGWVIGVIAIIAGILVLALPHFVQWVVGIFFIVWGILAIIAYYRK